MDLPSPSQGPADPAGNLGGLYARGAWRLGLGDFFPGRRGEREEKRRACRPPLDHRPGRGRLPAGAGARRKTVGRAGGASRDGHLEAGQSPAVRDRMWRGMSRDRINGGSGAIVDMMNVVEFRRFSPPCVLATLEKAAKPVEPE